MALAHRHSRQVSVCIRMNSHMKLVQRMNWVGNPSNDANDTLGVQGHAVRT